MKRSRLEPRLTLPRCDSPRIYPITRGEEIRCRQNKNIGGENPRERKKDWGVLRNRDSLSSCFDENGENYGKAEDKGLR